MADQDRLDGSITNGTVAVGTSATLLPATKAPGRKTWLAYNDGTATVYLGGASVTATTGIPMGTSAFSPSIDLGNALVYGITAGGNGTVRIMEIS